MVRCDTCKYWNVWGVQLAPIALEGWCKKHNISTYCMSECEHHEYPQLVKEQLDTIECILCEYSDKSKSFSQDGHWIVFCDKLQKYAIVNNEKKYPHLCPRLKL